MIRVTHLINELEVGGAETQLVEVLRRIDRSRYEPSVIYLFGDGTLAPAIRGLDIDVSGTGLTKWNAPLVTARLLKILGKTRPDILHAHLVHATVLGFVSGSLTRGTRIVATRHAGPVALKDPAYRLEPKVLERIDRVVAVSQSVRRYLVDDVGVDPRRVRVVYNGLDLDRFDEDAARSGGGWPEKESGAVRIGAVSNWRPKKGLDVLLEAFEAVRARLPGAELWIAGGGDVPDDPGDGVTVWGPLAPGRVASYLNHLDIFVQPSRREPFGLTALEAMAAGRAVVASDVDGLAEMIEDGVTGRLVPPGDPKALTEAIIALGSDADTRGAWGRGARERARAKFSIEQTVRALQEIYDEVTRR